MKKAQLTWAKYPFHSPSMLKLAHHLGVVHKNEVYSIFVSHSEWIYSLKESHKDLKGKVHGYSWENFLSKVPQL
jgi:hypothetical protein